MNINKIFNNALTRNRDSHFITNPGFVLNLLIYKSVMTLNSHIYCCIFL